MQKKRKKSKLFLVIVSVSLLMALLMGAALSFAGKDKQKSELAGDEKVPEKKEPRKKKVRKAPGTFIPTEKVTADQAVAFPTDI